MAIHADKGAVRRHARLVQTGRNSQVRLEASALAGKTFPMNVVSLDVQLSLDGGHRGRVCRRPDGYFQFVTERLKPPTEELPAYWINDHPPSGLYDQREDALLALKQVLPTSVALADTRAVTFNIDVGPYPEPVS